MPSAFRRLLLAAACLAVTLQWSARPAAAVVIRDDVADSVHLNLGVAEENVGKLFERRRLDCTGTLIAPQWVLTAAHCLTDMRRLRVEFEGQNVAARAWYVHRRWNDNERLGFDIGLIRLRTPVASITPATLYRGSDEAGQAARLVGFGDHGDGQVGATDFDARRRTAYNVIDAVAPASGRPSVLVTDFDAPGAPGVHPNEGTTAPGDSGGPLFLGAAVAGITSWGSSDFSTYGDVARFTRVSAFANWVDAILARPGRAASRAFIGRPGQRIADSALFASFAIDRATFTHNGGAGVLTRSHGGGGAVPGNVSAVPEPATAALLLVLAPLMGRRRTRPA